MAIDNKHKRRAIAGIPLGITSVLPDGAKRKSWRYTVAWLLNVLYVLIPPDIVRAKVYTRTSKISNVVSRTSINENTLTRTSLSAKVYTRTSIKPEEEL